MELRQLRYLLALADERHFTRAATRLHIAQPALSQQIKRLEDEVGLALVDRTTRHVSLTPAGEVLAGRARRAVAEVDAAAAELSELSGLRTGRVVIGAMRSTGRFDLSALLGAFLEAHPHIDLVVREEPSEVMLQRLHADALDVAFLSVNRLDAGPDIQLHPLLDEPLVVRGLGVALLPESETDHEGPPVAAVPVRRPRLARDVTLAWRANRRHSPAARAFLALAQTADARGV